MQALEQQSLLFEHFSPDGVHAAILVLGRRVTPGARSLKCKPVSVAVAAVTNMPSAATAAACLNPAEVDSSIVAITKLVVRIDIRFISDYSFAKLVFSVGDFLHRLSELDRPISIR
jgi:hypothetical protein